MNRAYKARSDYLVAALNDIPGFECRSGEGAFYAFPRVTGAMQAKGLATDADLVFLQEVVGERLSAVTNTANLEKQGNSYPQFEYLADEVWPHHAYGRNAIYQKGHHGNAILSKNPFLGWDNVNVSQWWFSQRLTVRKIPILCHSSKLQTHAKAIHRHPRTQEQWLFAIQKTVQKIKC